MKDCDFCVIELSTGKIDQFGRFLLSDGWADSFEFSFQSATGSGAVRCDVVADLAL